MPIDADAAVVAEAGGHAVCGMLQRARQEKTEILISILPHLGHNHRNPTQRDAHASHLFPLARRPEEPEMDALRQARDNLLSRTIECTRILFYLWPAVTGAGN